MTLLDRIKLLDKNRLLDSIRLVDILRLLNNIKILDNIKMLDKPGLLDSFWGCALGGGSVESSRVGSGGCVYDGCRVGIDGLVALKGQT